MKYTLAEMIMFAVRAGVSRRELGRRLGYADPTRALRRLDAFLDGALPNAVQASRLATALGISEAQIWEAVAASREQQAQREREEAETRVREARARFVPHAWAITRNRRNPRPIAAVGVFGAAHFLGVDIPRYARDLDEDELVALVGGRCVNHAQRWHGRCGPFGAVEAYAFRKEWGVAWVFSTEGILIHREGDFDDGDIEATLALLNGRSLSPVVPVSDLAER